MHLQVMVEKKVLRTLRCHESNLPLRLPLKLYDKGKRMITKKSLGDEGVKTISVESLWTTLFKYFNNSRKNNGQAFLTQL